MMKNKFGKNFYLFLIPCALWFIISLDNFIRRKNILGGFIFLTLTIIDVVFILFYINHHKERKNA